MGRSICLFTLTIVFLSTIAWAAGVELFSAPGGFLTPVGVVTDGTRVRVLEQRGDWVRVKQDTVEGWCRLGDLASLVRFYWLPPKLARSGSGGRQLNLPSWTPERSPGSLGGLLAFIADGDQEERRLNDPIYRHRSSNTFREWGRLFTIQAPHYYWKGINLLEFWDEHLHLNLVKGKMNYGSLMGPLWSDEALESVLESHSGWLGNRELFGHGRHYFLELRYEF